jgi:hypothetical protein
MAKHNIVLNIDCSPRNSPDTSGKLMAIFSGTIDEIPISGEIQFRFRKNIAVYTVKSTNTLLTRHPDYRNIRRRILQHYQSNIIESFLSKAAREALNR